MCFTSEYTRRILTSKTGPASPYFPGQNQSISPQSGEQAILASTMIWRMKIKMMIQNWVDHWYRMQYYLMHRTMSNPLACQICHGLRRLCMTVMRRMCGRSWVEARGDPQPKLYIPSHFLRRSLLAFNSILASCTAALPTVSTDHSVLRSNLYWVSDTL